MKPILVVEDQKMLRTIMCDILEEHNFTTLEASDGVEGLDKIESNDIEIVISDIMMPNYNGLDFLEMLITLHPDIKILVATSLEPTENMYIQVKNLVGQENMIKKPVDEDELLKKLKSILGR